MHAQAIRLAGAVVGVALVLTGCMGSGKTRHFQLDMAPSMNPPAVVNIEVDRLVAADPLVQSEIMVQASSTEIRYYPNALWAASMSELVREKLSAEFGALHPNRPTILVSGRIRNCGRLEEDGAGYAHVRLDLALRLAGTGRYAEPLHTQTYEVRRPVPDEEAGTLVTELSRGLEELAVQIARDASAIPLGGADAGP